MPIYLSINALMKSSLYLNKLSLSVAINSIVNKVITVLTKRQKCLVQTYTYIHDVITILLYKRSTYFRERHIDF